MQISSKLSIYLLVFSATSALAESKIMNSFVCIQKQPAAKSIIDEADKSAKTKMNELTQMEADAKKLMSEIGKERNDLMVKGSMMSADAKFKDEKKIQDKERKLQEMQSNYQRIMQDLQAENEMVQMRLQPFIMEAIQNAQEVAAKNPAIDTVYDEATKQFIYKKASSDMNDEVIKLTEKKNEQKTVVAKNKSTTDKAQAIKTV